MKTLKKFDDFLNKKSKLEINENLEVDNQYPEPVPMEDEEEIEGEPEEGGEYIGNKLMNELAQQLGVQVVNNQIEFEGQKINYFSETEKFHVGKKKFNNIEEVIDYLTEEGSGEKPQPSVDPKPIHLDDQRRGRTNDQDQDDREELRRFESYRSSRLRK